VDAREIGCGKQASGYEQSISSREPGREQKAKPTHCAV